MVDMEQGAREREGKSGIEGYGNIHSLQRSPKKGILDPADALSALPERGLRAYSLQQPHNLPEIQKTGNVVLTNSKLGK